MEFTPRPVDKNRNPFPDVSGLGGIAISDVIYPHLGCTPQPYRPTF